MRETETENRERETSKILVFHTQRSNAYTIYTRQQNKGNPTAKANTSQTTCSSHTKTRDNRQLSPSQQLLQQPFLLHQPKQIISFKKERGVMASYPSQIPHTRKSANAMHHNALPNATQERTNTPSTKPNTTQSHLHTHKEGRQTDKPTSSTHQHPPPQTPPAASDPP